MSNNGEVTSNKRRKYSESVDPRQYLGETQTVVNNLEKDPYKWGVGEFNAIDPQGNPNLISLPKPNYPPLLYPPVVYPPLPPSQTRLSTLEMNPNIWGVGEFNDIDPQVNPKGGKNKLSKKQRINKKRKRTQRKRTNKRKIKTRKYNSRR